MDINAKINWKPGMALTSRTFRHMDGDMDFRLQLMAHIAAGNRYGRIPNTPFSCTGRFVKNTFEVDHLSCMALLPSGRILHIDERVTVNIPILYGEEYFLVAGFSGHTVTFEADEIPYVRPEYEFRLCEAAEVEAQDVMPLVRFTAHEGILAPDNNYLPPCLVLSDEPRLNELRKQVEDRLEAVATHPHLANEEARQSLLHLLFRLKAFPVGNMVEELVRLTQEVAYAVDFHICRPLNGSTTAIPQPAAYDLRQWFQWLDSFFKGMTTLLDKNPPEDTTIDYDTLLAQAKAELYDQLRAELFGTSIEELRKQLHSKLEKDLKELLMRYINGSLKGQLQEVLAERLSSELFEKLYVALFDPLFNALYVPEPEEKEFVPLI